MKKNLKNIGLTITTILIIVMFWGIASSTGIFGRVNPQISKILLPSPKAVLSELIDILQSGYLLEHIWISFQRVGIGFGIAFFIGILLGILMGVSKNLKIMLYPIFRMIAPIPGVAWVPLAILWFGLGNNAAIFIIIASAITPIVMNVLQGVASLDKSLEDVMIIMKASYIERIRYMIIPSIIPYLVTGLKLGLGYAWRAVIAAEMVGVPGGLGYVLSVGRSTAKTEITIITMIVLSVMLIIMEECLFMPLEKITNHWKKD